MLHRFELRSMSRRYLIVVWSIIFRIDLKVRGTLFVIITVVVVRASAFSIIVQHFFKSFDTPSEILCRGLYLCIAYMSLQGWIPIL